MIKYPNWNKQTEEVVKEKAQAVKKTTAKRIGFNAPEDVAAILSRVEGNITDFICDAIREKEAREKNRIDS